MSRKLTDTVAKGIEKPAPGSLASWLTMVLGVKVLRNSQKHSGEGYAHEVTLN
jgi:hypothetical protein